MKFEKKLQKDLKKLDTLPMLRKQEILEACPTVPAVQKGAPVRRRFSFAKAATVAMAALLMAGGGVAVVAETMAYNEAIDFFEQYNMSAEGFTRSEVKKIYKDIITESFTYEKTEEALASGLEGYEIQARPLDSEGLKRVWMTGYEYGVELKDYADADDRYSYNSWYRTDENGRRQYVQWQKNGEKQWGLYLSEFTLYGAVPAGDQVMLVGGPSGKGYKDYTLRVYLLEADSTEVWMKDYPCPYPGTSWISFEAFYYENDTMALFVTDWVSEKMWILTLDMEGNVVNEEFVDYPDECQVITNVVRQGDDYLMVVRNGNNYGLAKKSGNKIEKLQFYGEDQQEYLITDIVEYNGLVYLSGMIYPKRNVYEEFESAHIKDGELCVTDEEAYEFYTENHTAVLLICDPETGEPQSFYTIPGARGSALSVKEGKLTWEVYRYNKVKSHTDLKYYQANGSFGEITAGIWQYAFTPYGQVVGEKNTYFTETFEGY